MCYALVVTTSCVTSSVSSIQSMTQGLVEHINISIYILLTGLKAGMLPVQLTYGTSEKRDKQGEKNYELKQTNCFHRTRFVNFWLFSVFTQRKRVLRTGHKAFAPLTSVLSHTSQPLQPTTTLTSRAPPRRQEASIDAKTQTNFFIPLHPKSQSDKHVVSSRAPEGGRSAVIRNTCTRHRRHLNSVKG